jgi:hypothetical protein
MQQDIDKVFAKLTGVERVIRKVETANICSDRNAFEDSLAIKIRKNAIDEFIESSPDNIRELLNTCKDIFIIWVFQRLINKNGEGIIEKSTREILERRKTNKLPKRSLETKGSQKDNKLKADIEDAEKAELLEFVRATKERTEAAKESLFNFNRDNGGGRTVQYRSKIEEKTEIKEKSKRPTTEVSDNKSSAFEKLRMEQIRRRQMVCNEEVNDLSTPKVTEEKKSTESIKTSYDDGNTKKFKPVRTPNVRDFVKKEEAIMTQVEQGSKRKINSVALIENLLESKQKLVGKFSTALSDVEVNRTKKTKTSNLSNDWNDEAKKYTEQVMVDIDAMSAELGYVAVPYELVQNITRKKELRAVDDGQSTINDRCSFCKYILRPGDKATFHTGCTETIEKHLVCEVCTYTQCLRVPTSKEEFNNENVLRILQINCHGCTESAKGYYQKILIRGQDSTTYVEDKDWVIGDDVRQFKNVLLRAMHQRSNIFCNWIVSETLVSAVFKKESAHKSPENSINNELTEEESYLYSRYYTITCSSFKCYNCNTKKKYIECCTVRKCLETCTFKLCLKCFSLEMASRNATNTREDLYNGKMQCPVCKVTDVVWHPIIKKNWCVTAKEY